MMGAKMDNIWVSQFLHNLEIITNIFFPREGQLPSDPLAKVEMMLTFCNTFSPPYTSEETSYLVHWLETKYMLFILMLDGPEVGEFIYNTMHI